MRAETFEKNELEFMSFIKEVTQADMSITDFLDAIFVSWFYPISMLPAKFHQREKIIIKIWTNDEFNLLRAYIWDNCTFSLMPNNYVIQNSDDQKLFLENCRVYGTLFFEGLRFVSDNMRRELFNELLIELIRVGQYPLLKKFIVDNSNLVNFTVLLTALERAYSAYSMGELLAFNLRKMGEILKILPEIHIALSLSEAVHDHSMREMRAEIKPVVLVRDEDDHDFIRERFSRMMRLVIAIPNPAINDFFSQEYSFLFKQFDLLDCDAWLKAQPPQKNEKKLEVARHVFIQQFDKIEKSRFFEKFCSHVFLNHVAADKTLEKFFFYIFDRGTNWFIGADVTIVAVDKKLQKTLLALGWIFDNKITRCAPVSQEALNRYRFDKPEAIAHRKKLYHQKLKKLECLIENETHLLVEADKIFSGEFYKEGSLFWQSHQSLKKYCTEKEVVERELALLAR